MRMVHDFDEFCKLQDAGLVSPDVHSTLGAKSVEYLRGQGWEIGRRPAGDVLRLCRQSRENFKLAYSSAGIDFWVKD